MGSWNHTCAVSNLHIHAGTDVTVFLLVKKYSTEAGSFCYGNALYDVVPLPFYGKYDDYGGVEDCHGFGLPIILETLKKRLYKFGQGPNSCHDCVVTPELLDVEMLFEADHEGRLGIDDPAYWDHDTYDKRELENLRDEKGLTEMQQFELDRLAAKIKKQDSFREVTHVVIHGDIFKAIMEKWYIEEYAGEGKGDKGYKNSYRHIYFKDLVDSIPEYISRRKAAEEENMRQIRELQDIDKDADPEKFHALYRLIARADRDDWNDPCLAIRWMNYFSSGGGSSVWDLIEVKDVARTYIENKDWDNLEKFVREAFTAAWVNSFMSHTRKIWVKQSGQGSQNSEPLGYTVLAQATLDILEAERRESGDEEDYEQMDLFYDSNDMEVE